MKKFLLLLTTMSFQLLCMDLQEQLRLKDLPKEIISLVALQFGCLSTIYNFKLVCSTFNQLCNIDNWLENESCAHAIASHFKECDQVLIYYTKTKNHNLFQHIWNTQSDEDKKKRKNTVRSLCDVTYVNVENAMRAYSGNCENKVEELSRQQREKNESLKKHVRQGNRDVVEILLKNGADPNSIINKHKFGLHIVAEQGDVLMIELLVKYGANVRKKNIENNGPLHYAAHGGNVGVLRILFNKGALIDNQNNYGETPLHIACKRNNRKAACYLVKQGANINAVDCWNNTPLNLACTKGSLSIMKLLLQKGAHTNIGNNNRQIAYWNNRSDILTLLDKYKVPLCLEEHILIHFFKIISVFGVLYIIVNELEM
jgi:hypothetical protein